jgi:hypothetical protein
MIDHKHMAASSDPARTLREPKARLSGIGQELDEGQTLLPERQRSTGIDDDIAEAVVSLDMAENSIDAVLRQLAKVTGEELSAAKSVLTNTMATLADADEDARRAQQGVEAALTPLFIAEADRVIARPQVCTRTFIENTKSCFGSEVSYDSDRRNSEGLRTPCRRLCRPASVLGTTERRRIGSPRAKRCWSTRRLSCRSGSAKKERPPRGGPSSCNSGIGQLKTAIGSLLRRKPA